MKKKWTKRLLNTVVALMMLLSLLPTSAFAAEGPVAQIGDQTYTSLDDAVTAAEDGATIELLGDATTEGMSLNKELTIQAVAGLSEKPTVTFTKYGIAMGYGAAGKPLTFKDIDIVINGIGSTPATGEWNWMTICAGNGAQITLDNVVMTMDATGVTKSTQAIYFCGNNVLNILNGSNLTIKNYPHNALSWDGGPAYTTNIENSTFVSDHNRSGFTGTFDVNITNSNVSVINSTGNGSNGSHFVIDNSTVNFNNNGSHGLSAGNLTIRNKSTVNANDNGMYGITYTGTMSMDGTSVVNVYRNALVSSGGGLRAANTTTNSTVANGAIMNICDNGHNGLENYGTFTFEDSVTLTITGNDERTTNGGGIFNGSAGNLTLPTGAVITNNHAGQTGGGICNAGTITIPSDVKLYNNHSDTAGDDVYNRDGATMNLPAIGDSWYLDDCDHIIDGYYTDCAENRWEAHADTEAGEVNYISLYDGTAISGLTALKAAHGENAQDKTSYPGLDKFIVTDNSDVKEDGVAAGDTVNFKLTSNVPDDLTNYIIPDVDDPDVNTLANVPVEDRGAYVVTIHDRMDDMLTNMTTPVVTLDREGTDNDVVLTGDQYTLTTSDLDDGCTFEISIDLIALYEAGVITDVDIENATPIVVTYSATLSENATAGDYINTAWVTYPEGQSSESVVTVKTYGISIFKYDQASNEALPGAVFQLYQKSDDGNVIIGTVTSESDGYARFDGLDEGTYYLKETNPPEGYVGSDSEVTIVIPGQANAENMVSVRFANSQIPHTGGMGTTMFTVGGAAILAAAGALFVVSRRKETR